MGTVAVFSNFLNVWVLGEPNLRVAFISFAFLVVAAFSCSRLLKLASLESNGVVRDLRCTTVQVSGSVGQ
jgi:hypothetical protein